MIHTLYPKIDKEKLALLNQKKDLIIKWFGDEDTKLIEVQKEINNIYGDCIDYIIVEAFKNTNKYLPFSRGIKK